ncbi:MAG TPA: deoxyhypusine synthase [archaeon]|nr:deoxyhypusine synthase [archaeon]
MKNVKQMSLETKMSVGQLINEMSKTGVLGAGRLAKGVDVLVEMFEDKNYTVFLGISGPAVPGGLRKIFGDLIDRGYVNAVVSNGANIVHDIVESLGFKHIKGEFLADDEKLREKKIGRIGDIYIQQKAFEALEKKTYAVLKAIPEKERIGISIRKLLYEFGKSIKDKESILFKASKRGVPIFCPGFVDSMLGLNVWTFSQLNKISVDSVADLNELSNIVFDSKKTGAIILGGGLTKHYILGANILREGVDAAIQITLDRPEGGSLSGAPLEEAISWRKAKEKGKLVTIIGDMTIIFPIMIAAAFEKIR